MINRPEIRVLGKPGKTVPVSWSICRIARAILQIAQWERRRKALLPVSGGDDSRSESNHLSTAVAARLGYTRQYVASLLGFFEDHGIVRRRGGGKRGEFVLNAEVFLVRLEPTGEEVIAFRPKNRHQCRAIVVPNGPIPPDRKDRSRLAKYADRMVHEYQVLRCRESSKYRDRHLGRLRRTMIEAIQELQGNGGHEKVAIHYLRWMFRDRMRLVTKGRVRSPRPCDLLSSEHCKTFVDQWIGPRIPSRSQGIEMLRKAGFTDFPWWWMVAGDVVCCFLYDLPLDGSTWQCVSVREMEAFHWLVSRVDQMEFFPLDFITESDPWGALASVLDREFPDPCSSEDAIRVYDFDEIPPVSVSIPKKMTARNAAFGGAG